MIEQFQRSLVRPALFFCRVKGSLGAEEAVRDCMSKKALSWLKNYLILMVL